jgi:L-threonylcarbamoyladenylate synthase
LDPEATAKIFEAKKRPSFNPLILHVSSLHQLESIAEIPSKLVNQLINKFWPGPLTLVLPKKNIVPDIVTSGHPTVAVRMPNNEIALKLIELAEVPIAAPSANKFTRLSPTTAEHVANQLGSKVSIILDGGKCSVGVESTIIAFIENEFVLLRPGGLPVNEIENLVGKIKIKSGSDNPIAPGMLPFHYAPKVKIKFLDDVDQSDLLNKKVGGLFFSENKSSINFEVVKILSTKRDFIEAASNLFSMLHEFESEDLDLILVERVPEENLGIAIMDRLTKAVNKYS